MPTHDENLVKTSPVDFEMICLKRLFKKRKLTQAEHTAGEAGVRRRLNKNPFTLCVDVRIGAWAL